MLKCLHILLLAFLTSSVTPSISFAQDAGCKFLNEQCDKSPSPYQPPKAPARTFNQHLERCLSDYVRRQGPFRPEGQSTAQYKSRSDMTSMCTFAIQHKNYYWDIPDNFDETASFNCCVKVQGGSTKICRDAFARARELGVRTDWCSFVH
jgi:hypothetical protein